MDLQSLTHNQLLLQNELYDLKIRNQGELLRASTGAEKVFAEDKLYKLVEVKGEILRELKKWDAENQ